MVLNTTSAPLHMIAIVDESLPSRVIAMTRRGATSPIALAMRDLGEVTKLGFGAEGVKMCRSGAG